MERRRGKADTKTGAITVDFEPAREIDGGQKLALPPGEPPKK
jgi:hypothetical protein